MTEILRQLGLPEWVIRCAVGSVRVPEFTVDVPADLSYGFPPALIPIWSDSSGPVYIGVLHHCFGPRGTSFVRLFKEDGVVEEIALTADQFRTWLVFDFLANVPDTDEVEAFAEDVGFGAADLEEEFRSIDTVNELVRHSTFAGGAPAGLLRGQSAILVSRAAGLRDCSDFDVDRSSIEASGDVPSWLRENDRQSLFEELMDSGELLGAWLCLNSSGWHTESAKQALERLAERSDGTIGLIASWYSRFAQDGTSY